MYGKPDELFLFRFDGILPSIPYVTEDFHFTTCVVLHNQLSLMMCFVFIKCRCLKGTSVLETNSR